MGAYIDGQETAIAKFKALPDDVRAILSHHLRNSLTVILAESQMEDYYCGDCAMKHKTYTEDSAKHILKDLKMFGL